MIKALAHLCIGTTNLAATERFYCDVLGLRKRFEFIREGEPIGFYLEVAPKHYIEVFRRDAIESVGKHPIAHFCLEVDDIDHVIARLTSHGVAVSEKKLGADQSWQAWTHDPSGIPIEFHEYTEQSSQVTGEACAVNW